MCYLLQELFGIMILSLVTILSDEDYNSWKHMCTSRLGPFISHILFDDNLILFFLKGPPSRKALCILHFPYTVCLTSGQKINNKKYTILFSKNVGRQLEDDILQYINYTYVISMGNYIRAHISQSRYIRGKLSHTVRKSQSRVSGLKHLCLSLPRRFMFCKMKIVAFSIIM